MADSLTTNPCEIRSLWIATHLLRPYHQCPLNPTGRRGTPRRRGPQQLASEPAGGNMRLSIAAVLRCCSAIGGRGVVWLASVPLMIETLREVAGPVRAVSWLRERSLNVPAESVARLLLDNGKVLGFYALASGSAELTVSQRRELGGSERRTQPATLLSQIARDIRAPAGTGGVLLLHAVAV